MRDGQGRSGILNIYGAITLVAYMVVVRRVVEGGQASAIQRKRAGCSGVGSQAQSIDREQFAAGIDGQARTGSCMNNQVTGGSYSGVERNRIAVADDSGVISSRNGKSPTQFAGVSKVLSVSPSKSTA